MTLQIISFALAILLAVLAFGLMKHTADEFDRWYEEEAARSLVSRIPVGLVGMLSMVAFGIAFLIR